MKRSFFALPRQAIRWTMLAGLFVLLAAGLAGSPQQARATDGTVTNCTLYDNHSGAPDTLGELLPGGGTILFDCDGTIILPADIQIDIKKVITLNADGHSVTIQANGFRVFDVGAYGALTLSGITVSGGTVTGGNGGAIYIETGGEVTLQDGTILTGSSAKFGGSIYNDGLLTIRAATITGNSAAFGGGIANDGTASVIETAVISGNTAETGGGIYNTGYLALAQGTTVSNNSADYGGGIYNYKFDDVTRSLSLESGARISGNTATYGGGGIFNQRGHVAIWGSGTSVGPNNYAPHGGGIYNQITGDVHIYSGAQVTGNAAEYGGGVYNASAANLEEAILSNNTATVSGGAWWSYPNSSTTITDSCIVNNSHIAMVDEDGASITATYNWWGAISGPGPAGSGAGDTVSPGVDFRFFLTAPILECPITPTGSLSGIVFRDDSGNGVYDAGEPGLDNVEIRLIGTDDQGAVNRTVITAAGGLYQFDLRPGTYALVETQPASYADGPETVGALGGMVGSDMISDIAANPGDNGVGYNFGETIKPPILRAPAESLLTRDKTPVFSWRRSTGATSYRLEVDDNPDFLSPALSQEVTAASYTPTTALENRAYYWRVKAGNAWSDTRHFTIDAKPPGKPRLVTPANGSSTLTTPLFKWRAVSGATKYRLQIDDNSDFSSPIFNGKLAATSYMQPTALPARSYYWRVQAQDRAGNIGKWSAVRGFTVNAPLAPPTSTLTPTLEPPSTAAPTATATATAAETMTPTETSTGIPTDTPVPTEMPTDLPTNTPVPSETPTGTPTETPTSIPTETPTGTPVPSETPTDIVTEEAPAPEATGEPAS